MYLHDYFYDGAAGHSTVGHHDPVGICGHRGDVKLEDAHIGVTLVLGHIHRRVDRSVQDNCKATSIYLN